MTTFHPPWPPKLYKEFESLYKSLGYKLKGKDGRWNLMRKMIAYAKEHPSIFSH